MTKYDKLADALACYHNGSLYLRDIEETTYECYGKYQLITLTKEEFDLVKGNRINEAHYRLAVAEKELKQVIKEYADD